jgi:predicted phage terminase large subunit-like protein
VTTSSRESRHGPSPDQAAAELLRRRKARNSLLDFTLYTKGDYEPSWHHRLLASAIDRFERGEIKRLIVNMPPQHGKSEQASRRLPAWLLGRNPDLRVIACSNTADLASSINRDVQRIIDDDAYQRLFPDTQLSGERVRSASDGAWLRNSDEFEVVGRRGYYKCAGVGGTIVGRGFDVGIIDDPIRKREEADSPAVREAIWKWYMGDFYTRRGKDARIIVIMTRWHEDDLVGRLLHRAKEDPKADQWEVLTLPAVCLDPPGPGDPRQPGEALWPDRYPVADLEKVRAASAYDWSSQYQQQPRPEGGTEWPEEYFGPSIWFDEWPERLTLRVISLDPSKGRESKWGDYSALVLLGRAHDGTLYVEADLQRRPTPRIVADGLEHYRTFGCDAFGVEANAFQELLAEDLARQSAAAGIALPVWGITNSAPKPVRIRRLGPLLAQKRIRFKGGHAGTRLLVQQLRDFPCGDHDDGPDALEMALRLMVHLQTGRREQGIGRLRST